jgi:hypothetical protein
MSEVTIAVLAVAGLTALTLLRLAMRKGALAAGQAARERRIARTGKDPADNPVTNGVNRWAERNPVGAKIVTAALVLAGVVIGMWRVAT